MSEENRKRGPNGKYGAVAGRITIGAWSGGKKMCDGWSFAMTAPVVEKQGILVVDVHVMYEGIYGGHMRTVNRLR